MTDNKEFYSKEEQIHINKDKIASDRVLLEKLKAQGADQELIDTLTASIEFMETYGDNIQLPKLEGSPFPDTGSPEKVMAKAEIVKLQEQLLEEASDLCLEVVNRGSHPHQKARVLLEKLKNHREL